MAVPSMKNWTVPVGMAPVATDDTVTLRGILPVIAQSALVVVTEVMERAVPMVLPPPAGVASCQSLARFNASMVPRPLARS